MLSGSTPWSSPRGRRRRAALTVVAVLAVAGLWLTDTSTPSAALGSFVLLAFVGDMWSSPRLTSRGSWPELGEIAAVAGPVVLWRVGAPWLAALAIGVVVLVALRIHRTRTEAR